MEMLDKKRIEKQQKSVMKLVRKSGRERDEEDKSKRGVLFQRSVDGKSWKRCASEENALGIGSNTQGPTRNADVEGK